MAFACVANLPCAAHGYRHQRTGPGRKAEAARIGVNPHRLSPQSISPFLFLACAFGKGWGLRIPPSLQRAGGLLAVAADGLSRPEARARRLHAHEAHLQCNLAFAINELPQTYGRASIPDEPGSSVLKLWS